MTARQLNRRRTVGLLELEPDLARFLSEEQRAAAERFGLPVAVIDEDEDVEELIDDAGSFGALVLDGLLVQAVSLDAHTTLRLIGPGGIAPVGQQPRSISSLAARVLAAARTELVLLGDEFLLASRRWPWLVAALHGRMMEQSERLMTQLAICQLPRVEDRVMAMMWLLADRWGRVTPAGVRLPLSLSHETLGGLVGARRPTVTLALTQLAERNALIKQGHEWLILEQRPGPAATGTQISVLLSQQPPASPWIHGPESGPRSDRSRVPVEDAARLREACAHNRERAGRSCFTSAGLCEQSRELKRASEDRRRARGIAPTA